MALLGRGRLVVVAFDPGETTGYARLSLSKRLLMRDGTHAALREAGREGRVRYNQFGLKGRMKVCGEPESADYMRTLTRLGWVEEVLDQRVDSFAVVIEDFVLFRSEKSRSLLAPVRITARYEQIMGEVSGIYFAKQSSSDAKNVVTDARLRKWAAFPEDASNYLGAHSKDALRHAILFARKFSSTSALRARVGVGLNPPPPLPSQPTKGGEGDE